MMIAVAAACGMGLAVGEPAEAKCTDHDVSCAAWSAAGKCTSSLALMKASCPLACGFCGTFRTAGGSEWHCQDFKADCSGWAALGLCERNPAAMLEACALSCSRCVDARSAALRRAEEQQWSQPAPPPVPGVLNGEPAELHELVATTNCTDSHQLCATWALDGQCHRAHAQMRLACPRSCGLCGCADATPACTEWAEAGKCVTEYEQMAHMCPRSCSLCAEMQRDAEDAEMAAAAAVTAAALCLDTRPDCAGWAAVGECERNPAVPLACPKSCGNCEPDVHEMWRSDELDQPDTEDEVDRGSPLKQLHQYGSSCIDSTDECETWVASGECQRNRRAMQVACAKSCDLCRPQPPVTSRTAAVDISSVATTSVGAQPCLDLQRDCAGWAQLGECQRNAIAMHANCALSCGVCKPTSRPRTFASTGNRPQKHDQPLAPAYLPRWRRSPFDESRWGHWSLDTWVKASLATNLVLAVVLLVLFLRRIRLCVSAIQARKADRSSIPLPLRVCHRVAPVRHETDLTFSPRRIKGRAMAQPQLTSSGTSAETSMQSITPPRKELASPPPQGVG